jgi:hypothetical protein
MHHGLRLWIAICLSLSFLPSASAATQIDVQLQAAQLQAQGTNALQSGLLAFAEEHATEKSPASADWHLSADVLRQEVDHTDFMAGPTTLQPTSSPPNYYRVATVDGTANRDGFRLLVFPMDGHAPPTFTSAASCMQLQSSKDADFVRQPAVQNSVARTNLTAHVANAVDWNACTQDTATVTGDFRIIFYEWDAHLQAGGGSLTLTSGKHSTTPQVDTADLLASADEQFLYAWNAVLTIPLGAHPLVYLDSHAQLATGQLQLQDARGLSAPVQHLVLTGQLGADVAAQAGQPIETRVTGRLDGAEGDGQPLTLTSAPNKEFPWIWVGLGAVLASAATLPVLRHRRVVRPTMEWRIETLLGRRHTTEALELSRTLVKRSPGPAARLLHARVLAHAGSLLDAHDQHAWLGKQQLEQAVAAENAFQAAYVAARLHRQASRQDQGAWRERAVAWMRDCLRLNPALASDLEMLPELEPFWDDVRPVQAAW